MKKKKEYSYLFSYGLEDVVYSYKVSFQVTTWKQEKPDCKVAWIRYESRLALVFSQLAQQAISRHQNRSAFIGLLQQQQASNKYGQFDELADY